MSFASLLVGLTLASTSAFAQHDGANIVWGTSDGDNIVGGTAVLAGKLF